MASIVEETCRVNLPELATVPRWREKDIVKSRAAALLRRSAYPEVRRVACEFHEGVLFLRGHVRSYYFKQIAQTVVMGLDGVEEIHNQLEVITPPVRR